MDEPDTTTQRRATRGGSYVLALTGLFTLVLLSKNAESVTDYALLGLGTAVLLWGALRLAKFVREHGAEIGEARFDTRNKE